MNHLAHQSRAVVALACGLLLMTTAVLYAGPLNPPPGPVTSTGKTLTEVEPRIAISATNTPGDADSQFKITQPGSYYLTGNITGVAGKSGIEIATSGVCIDLGGFALTGVAGSRDGIANFGGSLGGIVVKNGVVRNWGGNGVELSNPAVSAPRIERIQAIGNVNIGINVGPGALVLNCAGDNNGAIGINTGPSSVVEGCTGYGNTTVGIAVASGGSVRGCTASTNTSHGIQLGSGSLAEHCATYNNDGRGIDGLNGITVANCTVYSNGATGLVVGTGAIVRGCNVYSNGSAGIVGGVGTRVTSCSTRGNSADGITCGSRSIITDCMSIDNATSGSGSGIRITSDGRLEGNTSSGNRFGIAATGTGNFIARNTCSGNTTNWSIVADNFVGTIVAPPASGAISGDAGGSGVGSTNPNSNFTY